MTEPEVVVRPAATVIILRDDDDAMRVLFVRRNASLAFHGGSWVFPGGRVEDSDYPGGRVPTDSRHSAHELAAREAAVREVFEESGLTLSATELVMLSHWTTPPGPPRRFSTWFFVARADRSDVTTEGGEITDHRWLRPIEALEAQQSGDMVLPGPTYVSLLTLDGAGNADAVIEQLRSTTPPRLVPRVHEVDGSFVALYAGDVAYEDPAQFGEAAPRHRLWMTPAAWRYERTDL